MQVMKEILSTVRVGNLWTWFCTTSLFWTFYQPGELSSYAAIYDHLRWRQRNKDQGFLPVPPYVYPHANHYASAGEASQYHETPFGSKPHYLFVIHQLLHYTVTHLHAEHEVSRVYQNNVCRERYHLPAIFSHPHWDTGYQWTSTAHMTLPKTKSIFNFSFFQIAWSGPGLRQLLFL